MAEPARTAPTPAVLRRSMFDRHRWERALLSSDVSIPARAVGLVLAHHAATTAGYLQPGGPQRPDHLARETHISPAGVRRALTALEDAGLLTRPDIHTWRARRVWPVTLTLPPAAPPAEAGGERTEPPNPQAVS
ncbi:hypothetical protein [Streptomyces sp. bgisy154]|uniref:hypothetical protein n=1 Tax=Streptomyces sp. bgisy154 TaxID=3413794 RepID=UPI003D70A082